MIDAHAARFLRLACRAFGFAAISVAALATGCAPRVGQGDGVAAHGSSGFGSSGFGSSASGSLGLGGSAPGGSASGSLGHSAPVYGAPVVSLAVPSAPPDPGARGARGTVMGGTAVKVGLGLLLTAGHVIDPRIRAAASRTILVDGSPSGFDVVASGAVDPAAERAADAKDGWRPNDGRRGEDWVLLRLARPSLAMAPYAELDWGPPPKTGARVYLVAPAERHVREKTTVDGAIGPTPTVAIEGTVVDAMLERGRAIPGVIPFRAEDRLYRGCSGAMVAERDPGDPSSHASRWRMVGLFVAGAYAKGAGAGTGSGPRPPEPDATAPGRSVIHLAIPLPRELRAILARERASR